SPPSGPTSRRTRAPGARVGGKLAVSVVPGKRAGPTTGPSTVTARSQRQSRRSAGSSSARTSASGRGVSTVGTTPRPHCFAASVATRCQRRARSRQRPGSRVTTVRAVRTGTTCATPSSVDARTIDSILSPLGTDCTGVIWTGDSVSRVATASTVPVARSPTRSRRTVYSRPAPSAASTVSPDRRRRTRVRWCDSLRSKTTRPPAIRSGVIVKRRTELERGPALHGEGLARNEPVAAEGRPDLGRLTVEDAAEQQRPARQQKAPVLRREPSMGRREQIGDDQRRVGLLEPPRVGEHAPYAVGDVVAGSVRHRGSDGVRVVVHREDRGNAQPRGRDREDARPGAEVDHAARAVAVDHALERLQAPGR